jgi:murein DD-endopeptidase MepM/ murein hydrolase activator NlpD
MRRAWLTAIALFLSVGFAHAGRSRTVSAPLAGPASPVAQAYPAGTPDLAPSQATLALAALDRKIADLDAEDEASKKELAGLGEKIAEEHARVILRGRAFYRMTRSGLLALGGGFDALVSHAMRVERARKAVADDLVAETTLRERGAELGRSLERVARDRIALASQRTAMDSARLAMQDEQRRRAAFDRAFQTSTGAGDYVPVSGALAADPVMPGGFQGSRGRLLFPVMGQADVRPARREGTDGPGLEIHAPAGASVRAIFGGHVAFADRYGAYGRIVIIDHGEHYYSVSGNLATTDARLGDLVSAGERIGTVGDEGQGPMLYLEIRHGAETVPPAPWLGL